MGVFGSTKELARPKADANVGMPVTLQSSPAGLAEGAPHDATELISERRAV